LLRLTKSCQAFVGNSRGFTLIEVLIALAILGVAGVAFLTALTTASTAIIVGDERTTAESLVRSELEYVTSQPFCSPPWSYNVSTTSSTSSPCVGEPNEWWDGTDPHRLPSEYGGYWLRVTSQGYDADIDFQDDEDICELTVEVYHSDAPDESELVLTTTTYRVFI